MSAKFIIKSSKDGQFYFNLYATNGRVIATSETYTTLQNCKKGVMSVISSRRPISCLLTSSALRSRRQEMRILTPLQSRRLPLSGVWICRN